MLDKTQVLTDLKILLEIDSSETDKVAWLNLMIPRTESDIRLYCNNDFITNTYDENGLLTSSVYDFPDDFTSVLEDLIIFVYRRRGSEGSSMEMVGDCRTMYESDFPAFLKRRLNKRKLMVVH